MAGLDTIPRRDLLDAARVIGAALPTFTAREFADVIRTQAGSIEEEDGNQCLLEFVKSGDLREVGPGIYSLPWKAPH